MDIQLTNLEAKHNAQIKEMQQLLDTQTKEMEQLRHNQVPIYKTYGLTAIATRNDEVDRSQDRVAQVESAVDRLQDRVAQVEDRLHDLVAQVQSDVATDIMKGF
jgi:chaperonin cofactor prefoldin